MAEPEDKKDPPGEATEEAATQPTPAAPSLPEDMPQTLPGVDASELRMQPVSGEETQAPLPQPADEQAEILAPSAAPPQEPVLRCLPALARTRAAPLRSQLLQPRPVMASIVGFLEVRKTWPSRSYSGAPSRRMLPSLALYLTIVRSLPPIR
jgi:hypothetical protein